MRVEFDGRPLPIVDGKHWRLALPARTDPATTASRFRVVLPTTCFEDTVEVERVSNTGELFGKWPAQSTLHVDREGVGSPATVSVGSFVVDRASMAVVVGSCPTAREIRVDEVVVGSMGASTIVDAKGGHCYEILANGIPAGARLEGKRVYEQAIDLFLASEVPNDKTALRRCSPASLSSLAAVMPASSSTQTVWFTPPSKPKPPPPVKPAKPPRK